MSSGPHAASVRPAAGDAADGEAPDFGALFRKSFRTLWMIAYGMVQDAALAEDVVQEAALIALSKIKEFRPGSDFAAWMAKIVRYVGLNQARARRRRRTWPLDGVTREPTAPTFVPQNSGSAVDVTPGNVTSAVEAMLEDGQVHFDDRVAAALKGLAHTARTCLLLRTIEGMAYAEIARVLHIPEGTAMSHVHRARQFLRKELADLGPPGDKEGRWRT